MSLVAWLEQKRIKRDESDTQFAASLGISLAFWSLLKDGKRQPGRKLVQSALRLFPDDQRTIVTAFSESKSVEEVA